ncbi:Rz1-like lysis system protein LysC [Fimbriiglobus ruber]|uniref:Rz1-like lysis system protein LysC n=1 Tax=Fimbriiglobus ruber TaxID=1908690 RepID=UPI003B84A54C
MKHPLLLIAALTLAGCQFSAPQSLPIIPPADLISACEPLPDFTGKDTQALLTYTVSVAYLYHECEAKQTALAQWSKDINQ